MKFTLCLTGLLLLAPMIGWAETLYSKSVGVKVKADKAPTSKTVARLKKGEAVEVVNRSGRYLQVKRGNGTRGWVFKFKLTNKKQKRGGGGRSLAALSGESTISANEARSGGSIRGLKEVSKRHAREKKIDPAHVQSVEKMEKRTFSEDELVRFKKEGKIGEFLGGGA